MHMSDALLSPAVGSVMWVASATAVAVSARKVNQEIDSRAAPMMGVVAAFVFAAQMVNFTIPATGSSGHLGGGLLLAILLGPHAGLLAMASILSVQALFFADGGLLALGCNIFNLGLVPAFIAYPLLFRPLAGARPDRRRMLVAALIAAVAGLILGAAGVVVETTSSGISSLPLSAFAALMLPIHLVIGVIEGVATAAVVLFVWQARPEVAVAAKIGGELDTRKVLAGLATAAIVVGGALSWFASTRPDGLEWAIAKVVGHEVENPPGSPIHATLESVQARTAVLPDYALGDADDESGADAKGSAEPWPRVSAGTTLSGLVGGVLTLALAGAVGIALSRRRQQRADSGVEQ